MNSDEANPVCLAVSGRDRIGFLQGQLTQDVSRLAREPVLDAAWCNPKGRVIALVTLVNEADRILLFLPAWQMQSVSERLQRYRLRADVELAAEPDVCLIAISSGAGGVSLPEGTPILAHRLLPGTEPRVMEVCVRREQAQAAGTGLVLDADDWSAAAIRAGRPALAPDTVEEFTPHMLNLDLLGAVSFRKGCYTGQEVVARTENLGRPSRRMLRFAARAAAPAPGSRLLDVTGEAAGTVIRSTGTDNLTEFLAVVSIKRLGGELTLEGGESAEERRLPYEIPELGAA